MRFNSSTKTAVQETQTVNHAGAKAYTLSPEMELYSAVVTTMLADAFYEKADTRLTRIQQLVPDKCVLANVDSFYKREGEVGYSTNGYLVLDDLIKRKPVVRSVPRNGPTLRHCVFFMDGRLQRPSRKANCVEIYSSTS